MCIARDKQSSYHWFDVICNKCNLVWVNVRNNIGGSS